ncbi:MAG: hypothetical protein H7Z38_19965, partial [Rubrivivax sp.]|nr:hypothetical protein [Pyrinomonadaceae bacterium]
RLELADALPATIADAQRVQQALSNLLSNAIKFTPAGGTVNVRTRAVGGDAVRGAEKSMDEEEKRGHKDDKRDARRGRWIEIEIEDTGEGINPDFMPFIWDRFRQADATATRRHGGLGIGLSLVREFVEAHGGHVEAASAKGRGARFTMRLPVIEVEDLIAREPRFDAGSGDRRDTEPNPFD